jgi:hypothetical protein
MEMDNTWIDFTITRGPIRGKDRNRVGLLIRIKARRDVEEFMSSLAQGRRVPVDAVADMWQNCNPDDSGLEFYEVDSPFENQRLYSLEHVAGPPIISQNNDGRGLRIQQQQDDVVNLSFLRLAGISNDSGITVGLIGAYSNDYLKKMKLLLPKAITQFLQDYIIPVTINLQVISKS